MSGYNCLTPNPGCDVSCSTDSSSCTGCGLTTAIQNLFTHTTANNCSVKACNSQQAYFNLNGLVCNSCSIAVGLGNIQKGKFYDGYKCTDTCPQGQIANASTNFICQNQPNPSGDVSCSTDSNSCTGCGQTTSIQNLFSHSTSNNCFVKDCTSQVVGLTLIVWICNSCSTATGSGNILKGKFYDGSKCTDTYPQGQIINASTGFACQQPPANPGGNVPCTSDSQICGKCGSTIVQSGKLESIKMLSLKIKFIIIF